MRNLDDPETFYEKLLLLVEMKQGNITLEPPDSASGLAGSGGGSTSGDDGTDD